MTQPTTTATKDQAAEYPLCSSCCCAVVNSDLSGHEGFGLDLLVCFMASVGHLVHTGTKPVPDTDEWTCAGCHELCIGDAEWMTTLN